jgi:hypothetical protein
MAVILAVIAWGIVHAIGAYRFNFHLLRGAVVLGCTSAFVGLWLIALLARARRLAQHASGLPQKTESLQEPRSAEREHGPGLQPPCGNQVKPLN